MREDVVVDRRDIVELHRRAEFWRLVATALWGFLMLYVTAPLAGIERFNWGGIALMALAQGLMRGFSWRGVVRRWPS